MCPTEGCNKNLTDQNHYNRKIHIGSCINKYQEKINRIKEFKSQYHNVEDYFQKAEKEILDTENTSISVGNPISSAPNELDDYVDDSDTSLVAIESDDCCSIISNASANMNLTDQSHIRR